MKTLKAPLYLFPLFGAVLAMSSCVSTPDSYGTYSNPLEGYSLNVSTGWTSASFDTNGFPIFGYSFGRPIYGYTAEGGAVFNPSKLNSTCYVPDWAPAPWYNGKNYYPSFIYRVAVPPYYPQGHHPLQRPPMGTQAPPRPVRYTPPGEQTTSSTKSESELQQQEPQQPEEPTEEPTEESEPTPPPTPAEETHRTYNILNQMPAEEKSRTPSNKEHGFVPPAGFSRGGSSRPHGN